MSAAHFLAAAFALCTVARGHENATVHAAKAPMRIPHRIAWLHIRKSGTSFVNTLLHHKDLCPGWPKDVSLQDTSVRLFWYEHRLLKLCPEGFSRTFESPPGCAGIGATFDQNEGRVMAMFRSPEQRMISEYFMQIGKERRAWDFLGLRPSPFFLMRWQGCITKSLTRQRAFKTPMWMTPNPNETGYFPWEPCVDAQPPTLAEVQLAVSRVKKMAFVGLTSEWSLSICLFHAMYGGKCKKVERINTRPGWKRDATLLVKNTTTYNEFAMLGYWEDPFDGPVYKEVRRVFWERVKEWGVTEAGCERTCTAAAE